MECNCCVFDVGNISYHVCLVNIDYTDTAAYIQHPLCALMLHIILFIYLFIRSAIVSSGDILQAR